MAEQIDGRGVFRLGVVAIVLAVLNLPLMLTMPLTDVPLWWWVALGTPGIVGIGLLFGMWLARMLAVLLLLAYVVLTLLSLLQVLYVSWLIAADLMQLLSAANALAATLLMTWMCVRAIQLLLGRRRRASVVTARLVGGVLTFVAVHHLVLASQIGLGWAGSWSVQISPQGMQMMGFAFWPLWHIALLVVALAMVAGPRRTLGAAATALMLLFASLVPLVIVAAMRTEFFVAQLAVFGTMLIPVYLFWWLRDELRGVSDQELETSDEGSEPRSER